MCGIAGIFHYETVKPVDPKRVERMTDAIAHRGPDGSGVWTAPGIGLGHRRLSIIDLAGSPQPMHSADERAVMLVGGDASVDGHALKEFELAVLQPGRDMTLASTGGARVMLMGGEAFTTKRHAWWNFVSSSRERINQAKSDWRAGRFPVVPGDEEEHIPLPQGTPKTVTYP